MTFELRITAHGIKVQSSQNATVGNGAVELGLHPKDNIGPTVEGLAKGIEVAKLSENPTGAFTGKAGLDQEGLKPGVGALTVNGIGISSATSESGEVSSSRKHFAN